VHDSLDLDTLPHREIANAINELTERSGLYPASVVLRGVEKSSAAPVAGGSFSDIWKGEVEGQKVAIKVMRIFDKDDANLLHEVYHIILGYIIKLNILRYYRLMRCCGKNCAI
jgi:hypothetical protein